MTNFDTTIISNTTSELFKGLKEDYQSQPTDHLKKDVNMLRCLRWAIKSGMSIEIKRAYGTLMDLRLVKRGIGKDTSDMEPEINVLDDRIEKGLWELEYKTASFAGLDALNELDFVIELLHKGRFSLPHHNDLRSEVLMDKGIIFIDSVGKDKNGNVLFGGSLFLNDEEFVRAEPQTRMGYVLDNLEKALLTKRRDEDNC